VDEESTVRRLIGLTLTVALALTGCTGSEPPDPPATSRADDARPLGSPGFLPEDLVLAGNLVGFEACDGFLDHVRTHALELVTPWGLGNGHRWAVEDVGTDAGGATDDGGPVPTAEPSAPVEGEDFSGTNVQEAGVDEPDTVKTDGEIMYVVTERRLVVLDVTGELPEELASVPLREGWDARLLLAGDHLLVTSGASAAVPFAGERVSELPYGGGWSTTTLTLIDVSDPRAPEVTERLTVDGATLSSRLVDGIARVVIRTEQGNLPWVTPEGSGLRAERRALEANRELIRSSVAEDWIPYAIHRTADGQETEGPLLACDRIARPTEFAGLGVVSILTVDPTTGGLRPDDATLGVLSGGETVYASSERLYVASNRWVPWETLSQRAQDREVERMTTQIHAFDTSDPTDVGYLGSGEVPGTLLSQWSMSEHDGHLRVASTVGDVWWQDARRSESVVSVLRLQGDELVTVGEVAGLGVTERIYAVRFMGPVGYVVTFRQTDPLYTLDLADPTEPRVVGELKIMGYSAYLHPVGDGLLLGVGQDADALGRTKGTQLSLFDVGDPADPQRIDQVTLGQGSSDVEYDHHAFLHWPATGLTVVPFVRWSHEPSTEMEDVQAGAYGFTADRELGIRPLGVLSHGRRWDDDDIEVLGQEPLWDDVWASQIHRSVVVGDRLLTVSSAGVGVHDLASLEDLGWWSFRG
jgi:hypothetical protein